jgi:hypothetical protein
MKRRGCDPKAPQVTGDQKKRSEHDGRRRSRGAATDHRWITQRATTCGGRHARGRRRTQPPLDQAKYGRTRKPEAEGKRWKAPSLARFRSDQDDTPPPTPRRRRPAHARTAGPETCPIRRHTSGPRPSDRSISADRIRFDTRHHRPALGSVEPVRLIAGWLYVLGSCRAVQTGRVTREPRKAAAAATSARRVASPLTCGPLSRRATGGLKTDGNFPFFPAPFSTFYRPVSVFSFRNPDEIQNGGCRDMDGSRNNVFPSVFSESRISSELFRI